MSNHQYSRITWAILTGVLLGGVALYWGARFAALRPAGATSASTNSVPATIPTAAVTAQSAPPFEPRSEPALAKQPVAAAKAPEASASNYEGPELPIVFAFSERFVYVTEENNEGNLVNVSKRIKEGIITNSSDKPLNVTAIEVNLPTQESSQIQFLLGVGAQKHFGSEQGLKMISGDQLTLRSESYRDSVQPIP